MSGKSINFHNQERTILKPSWESIIQSGTCIPFLTCYHSMCRLELSLSALAHTVLVFRMVAP
jgi:hypothetical protein